MKKHFWIIELAVIAAVALGTSTIVMAASKDTAPIDGSQTFYACMQRPSTESAQEIVPGSIITSKYIATWPAGWGFNPLQPACYANPDHYEIVSWNGTGQPGPAGPQGATGVSGYQVVQKSAKANPGQPVSVSCPSGKMVLGGGAKVEGMDKLVEIQVGHDTFAINDSQPTSNNRGWQATYGPAVDGPLTLTVWATCAKVTA